MTAITVRIPSKKVPYGFLEYQVEVDSVEPKALADMYATLIKEYQAAEVAAFEAAPTKPMAPAPVEDNSVEEAAKMLSDGLGATEIDPSEPVKPWNKTSDTTATEEKKPWVADDSDWDFS